MSSPPLRFLVSGEALLAEILRLGHVAEPLTQLGSGRAACLLLDGREPELLAQLAQLQPAGMPVLALAPEPCPPALWQAFEAGTVTDLLEPADLPQSLSRALVRLRRTDAGPLSLAQLSLHKNKALSTLYHQLQGPVTALEGYLEILRDEQLSAESVSQILAQLRHCVLRLRQHFNALHLLSLVSELPCPCKPRPYLFHQLIDEFQADFVQMQPSGGWKLQPDAQDDLVLSDPHLMLQLLSTLADLAQRSGATGKGLSLQTANLSAERLLARTRYPLDPEQFQLSYLPESPEALAPGFLQVTIQLRGVRSELYQTLLYLLAPERQPVAAPEPELLLDAWLLRQLLKAMQSWLYLEPQPGFGLLVSFVLPLHPLPETPAGPPA